MKIFSGIRPVSWISFIFAIALAQHLIATPVAALEEDVGVVAITEPVSSVFTSKERITVRIKNFGASPISANAFVIQYRIDGGARVYFRGPSVTLNPGAELEVQGPRDEDFFEQRGYIITASTVLDADIDLSNNAVKATVFSLVPSVSDVEISSFPHEEDFEGPSASNWTPYQISGSTPFELGSPGGGIPSKDWIVGAASGTNAWATSLEGFYTSSRSQVLSPIFDLRDIPYAEVSLNVAWESAAGLDGARVEKSIDELNWESVPASGDPENWYNSNTVQSFGSQPGWTGYKTAGSANVTFVYSTSGGYGTAGADRIGSAGYVLARNYVEGGEKTRFKIYFVGISGGSDEGFAFDDFKLSAAARASLVATIITDVNSDGIADPGDVVRFTATVSNLTGSVVFNAGDYEDLLSDSGLSLITGTVTSSHGTVNAGNNSSDTSVSVDIGVINAGENVIISYDATVGALENSSLEVCSQATVSTDLFTAATNDPGTEEPGDSACVTALGSDGSLTYSASTFAEGPSNNGTFSAEIAVTLADDTFTVTSGALTPGVHYSTANVPAGLSLTVTATSATTAVLKLTGTAQNHENENDVSDMTLFFNDAAFDIRPASRISGSSASFTVNFESSTVNPTPTPTPVPNQITGKVLLNGQPVSGALVYVLGLGTTTSDENGLFSLEGAEDGVSYEVFFQKAGVSFGNVGPVSSSQFVEVTGSAVNYNPLDCAETDISASLKSIGDIGAVLLGRINTSAGLVNREGKRGENISRKFITATTTYPNIILNCENIEGCSSVRLGAEKKKIRRQLANLSREALIFNKVVRSKGLRKKKKASIFARRIKRSFSQARRSIANLPGRTFSCES